MVEVEANSPASRLLIPLKVTTCIRKPGVGLGDGMTRESVQVSVLSSLHIYIYIVCAATCNIMSARAVCTKRALVCACVCIDDSMLMSAWYPRVSARQSLHLATHYLSRCFSPAA